MKQALHIKNLTKKYKDFTLDHISLDLPYLRYDTRIDRRKRIREINFDQFYPKHCKS